MQIGLVCNEYPPKPHGGIGSCSHDLAEGLVAAGHRVTVVGVSNQPKSTREIINGVTVVSLGESRMKWYRPREWFNRFNLKRWIENEQAREPFDLLEVPDYDGWLPWKLKRNFPVVARLHGSNLFFDSELQRKGNPVEHKFERQTLLRADFWLGVSNYAFRRTQEFCGVSERDEKIIYHGVDTKLFSPGTEPVEPGLIVFVNTINAKKGVEQLVDAANLLFASYLHTRLVLIGPDTMKPVPDAKNFPQQMHEKIKPEFRSRVIFTGRLPRAEIIPWLRQANVCCYPSHMETFGIAPVEAMAVGRPTIYSRTGPGPEVIENGVSGLLCDPMDPRDIANKIGQVLDQPLLAEQLGRAARQRVLERFDKKSWIPQNVNFFSECVKKFRETGNHA